MIEEEKKKDTDEVIGYDQQIKTLEDAAARLSVESEEDICWLRGSRVMITVRHCMRL